MPHGETLRASVTSTDVPNGPVIPKLVPQSIHAVSSWMHARITGSAKQPDVTGSSGRELTYLRPMSILQTKIGRADLGTKWEQDWQYQPNAATMYVRKGSIVTAL
jgi:hypothetical protein